MANVKSVCNILRGPGCELSHMYRVSVVAVVCCGRQLPSCSSTREGNEWKRTVFAVCAQSNKLVAYGKVDACSGGHYIVINL